MEIENLTTPHSTSITRAVPHPTTWGRHFTFRGSKLFYNRIPYNNRAERAVEIPIAFEFLVRQEHKESMLEIGNVLQYYENALSDALGIRHRRIVDKFEVGYGISNADIMDLDPEEKYQTIVSVSTVEHVGQNCAPTGDFGERKRATDLEAPLKAIAKIYDLLAVGGQALVTVPFGILTDGGWYIQYSSDYLDLLVRKYGIPREALSLGFLKLAIFKSGSGWSNPFQQWVEVEAEELKDVRYNTLRGGARAIVVIELTKLTQPFSFNILVPPTSLLYKRSQLLKSLFFIIGLLRRWLQ